MRIPRIYTGQALRAETTFDLEPGPSQHLARALRMQAGASLILFDGRGGEYPATITAVGKKQVSVTTGEHLQREAESPLNSSLPSVSRSIYSKSLRRQVAATGRDTEGTPQSNRWRSPFDARMALAAIESTARSE